MKKLISLIISASMLLSSVSYIVNAEENDVLEPVTYGEPSEWAVPEIDAAGMKGIITDSVCIDFQADITREQFCELVLKSYEKLNEEPIVTDGISFTDTENESVIKAAAAGIVNGYGEGIFAPNDKITREQIATMLVRMLDKADIGLDVNDYKEIEFFDADEISDWALPSMNFVYSSAIMVGNVAGRADAKELVSCEEGILLAYRTYDRFAYFGKKTLAQLLGDKFDEIATDKATALSLADELMKSDFINFSPATAEFEEGYLMGFGDKEIKGFKECAAFSPMVGTIPFMGYIFTLAEDADTDAFMTELEMNKNLNWNICTSAEEWLIKAKGNKVFFVMCPRGIEG